MLRAALTFDSPWQAWRPATCLPDDCFCEAIGDGLVRQPANTWSSLGFVVVALWVVLRRLTQLNRPACRPVCRPALSFAETGLFVVSLILVGVGSAFYHASLTFFGQVLDVSGMYLVASFILLHRLAPRFGLSPLSSVATFVGGNAALLFVQVTAPSLRRFAFGSLLASAVWVEWRSARTGQRWLLGSVLCIAVGFGLWMLDRWRVLCVPESLLQGHAAWHVLGALGAVCLVKSYEAEV